MKEPVGILPAMTVVTGIVDAVSFPALGRVFTANMTGNVVLLGFAFAGAPLSISRSAVALLTFLSGSFLGGRVAFDESSWSQWASTGVAMGLRSAIVRKLAVPEMTTTVTLTITGLASDSSLAGGDNPRWQRRGAGILATIFRAFAGARMAVHPITVPLAISSAIASTRANARRHLFSEGRKS